MSDGVPLLPVASLTGCDDRYLPVPVGFYTLKIVNGGKETVRGVDVATDTTGSRLEIAL